MTDTRREQDILTFVGQWAEAERETDPDRLDQMLDTNFIGIGPRGFLLTKDQWLERYRSGALENAAFDLEGPQVRDYGDAALIVGAQIQETSYRGNDSSGQFRATLMAIHPDDRWLLAGIHLSPMDAPPG